MDQCSVQRILRYMLMSGKVPREGECFTDWLRFYEAEIQVFSLKASAQCV